MSDLDRLLNPTHANLIKKDNLQKKRTCLRCGKVFLSKGLSNRLCGSCAAYVSKMPLGAR